MRLPVVVRLGVQADKQRPTLSAQAYQPVGFPKQAGKNEHRPYRPTRYSADLEGRMEHRATALYSLEGRQECLPYLRQECLPYLNACRHLSKNVAPPSWRPQGQQDAGAT